MKSLVLMTLILLTRAAFAQAQVYYSSNPIGMELGVIPPAGVSGKEWVLAVSREGNTETRVLYEKGKENTRWVETFNGGLLTEEKTYELGNLSRVTMFQAGELPVRVEEYSDGSVVRITMSRYSGGALTSQQVEGGDGKLLYRDEYVRGVDGRLLRVIRTYPDGKQAVTAFDYADGRLVNEWLGNGESGTLYRFDTPGGAIRESWKGSTLVERRTTTQANGGSEVITHNFVAGTATTLRYNAKGLLERQIETKDGKVSSTTDFRYEGDLLTSKIAWTSGAREETRYFYSKDGKLDRVEVSRNRRVVQVTYYTGPKSYYEDLYAEGRPVMRVYFENGTKTKEEPFPASGQSLEPASAGAAGP